MHPVYRSFIGLLAIILTVCPVYAQTRPTFDSAYGSTGSSDGLFDTPFGIATDAAGNVYVSDFTNNRVQKFDSAGNHLLSLGNNGSGQSQFITPHGVATDASGNLLSAIGTTTVYRSSTPTEPLSPNSAAPSYPSLSGLR